VKDVRNFLDSVLDDDIHTKRIASLANATLGVIIHIPRVRRRGLPWEWEGEEGQLWLR
jgi:hypothetical protein